MHGWIPANLFFSSVEAFLSLAHSSAKGYYATDREGLYYERQNYYANRACAINCHGQLYSLVKLVLARGRGIPCRPHPAAIQLIYFISVCCIYRFDLLITRPIDHRNAIVSEETAVGQHSMNYKELCAA